MVGLTASALLGVMNPVLIKLTALLGKECEKFKDVRKKIADLRDELSSMKTALEILSESEEANPQVKEWMSQLRELSYDAEDCIDQYMHNLSHGDNSDGLTHKLTSLAATLKARRRIGSQIKELMERALKVSDRHKRYEQSPYMSYPNSVVIDPRLHSVFEEADRLVGIDSQRDKLVMWLTDCIDLHPHRRMVVSIVGPGGLGKTTLANQVFQKITSQFDCTAFVSVSRSPNVNKILSDAFLQVLESNSKKTAEQSEDIARIQDLGHGGLDYLQLISRMRCYLQNKRYLVIIDDIWSKQAWKDIQCAFPQNKNASRIMTTTRILGVAESCCFPHNIYVYPMKPLDIDDSKRLFMKRTFVHEDDCPFELKDITDDILRKCDGLPLAIVNIASLLATKQPLKKEWEGVYKSIGSTLEQDHELGVVKNILFLSYYDLPNYLKICLLDLSIFPEDHQIDRLRLIRRWMAEGFINEQGRSMEETGESYISELINKNMIQPVGIDYSGRPRACRVHDIMLDLIVSLSTKENFATILDNQKLTPLAHKIRRLSIHGNCEERKFCQGTDGLRHTRSFSVFGDARKIPPLLDFLVLRVLDLENFTNLVDGDIRDIGCLIHLRYLSFSNISKIPRQIGKLQCLQTLDLRWTTIRELPGTVVQLRQLERLFLPYGVELPHGIDSMVALQELSCFCVARNSPVVLLQLGNLTKLKVLGIDWESNGDFNDEASSKKYLVSSLCKLGERNLLSLHISACVPFSLDFLADSWFPPPLQLQKFSSIGDRRTCLSRLPKWIPSLSELTCLQILVEQLRLEDMQALKDLPALLYLNLCTKECSLETLTISSGGFQRLKEFDFGAFSGGPGPIFEAGAMPRIEKLHFAFTVHDMSYAYGAGCDFGISHLSSLKGLWVIVDCFSARAWEVEAAEAAIRSSAALLPNHPVPKMYRMGERAMLKE